MVQEIFEWLLLLARWLHITVAIAWIGNSFFFMWLDRTLEANPLDKSSGHIGELWMVHGGGFYKVEKMQMGAVKVPAILHWFKWESYWTWLSGIFLLTLIFYAGSGSFLLDSTVSKITFTQGIILSLSSVVVSWLLYDFLWESKLTKKKPLLGHLLTLILFTTVSYILCKTLSGRAAYIHIGAMLGTWMTANVFLRIIPRQVKMVEASKNGVAVNQDWGKNAKNRSTHNTYFTLPVIFIMLSNHFPSTYGNNHNFLILILMSIAGAAIREYFVARFHKPLRSKTFALLAVISILSVVYIANEKSVSLSENISRNSQSKPLDKESVVPQSGSTGNIRGKVRYLGKLAFPQKLSLPFACNGGKDVFSNEIIVKDLALKNVLVRIVSGHEGKDFAHVPETPVILDQKGCMYSPRVIGVRVGQKVEILNSDPLFHNVRTFSKNNENFNLAMPLKDQRIIKVFTKPEIVLETKCSVHPWMSASIAVIDHPYFDVTKDSGEFEIKNIQPGKYKLEFWHEVFGSQTLDVMLDKDETKVVNFDYKK